MFSNNIKHPFIIIGMHRSGTTMLAEAMNRAGIFMGVMRDHNSEAFHFLSLNQQMLLAENRSWLDPVVPSPQNDKTLEANSIFAEHIKSHTTSTNRLQMQYRGTWGWKDPRNTYTLGLWLKRFPNAKVIHVVRDGRAVAKSLQTRNIKHGEVQAEELNDLGFCLSLWETYVQQALNWERELGKSCLRIHFEDLVEKDKTAISSLENFTKKNIGDQLVNRSTSVPEYSSELNALAENSELFSSLGYTI